MVIKYQKVEAKILVKGISCDDLIVVAQHQDEELWEAVQCFYEFIAKDKQAPWYENVRFKLIAPEELPDISSFKRTG